MSQRASKRKVSETLPPLEAGDRLTREEFERRDEAMPNLKKAELINGVVYLDSMLSPTTLKTTNGVPPLENGDHLTREEFERRYEAMPNLKKAELIEGVVFMGSPVRNSQHSEPHSIISALLGVYRILTPGVRCGDNGTVRLDLGSVPQPDSFLRIEEECGGQSRVSTDDYLEGGPELVVEVAASTASHDLNAKKLVYQRHRVREYIVWRTHDQAIDWFRLQRGRYVRVKPNREGIIESKVFPGLRLAVKALLQGDFAAALAEVQAGVASESHRAFVARLASRKNKTKKRTTTK
jgi:Uma2 family endonuclease